jgi:hypothetical protein
MPFLTRRRDPDSREETWLIFYGDVHVGTIAQRSGNPSGIDAWSWRCGFYPGSNTGDESHGTAADFQAARAAFESAWSVFLPKRTEADFEAWRHDLDSRAQMRAIHAHGEKLPSEIPSSLMRCVCGASPLIATSRPRVMITGCISMPRTRRESAGEIR